MVRHNCATGVEGERNAIFAARAPVLEKKKPPQKTFHAAPSVLSLVLRAPASGPGGVGALTSAGFAHDSEDSRHRRKDQPGRDTEAGQMTSSSPSDRKIKTQVPICAVKKEK